MKYLKVFTEHDSNDNPYYIAGFVGELPQKPWSWVCHPNGVNLQSSLFTSEEEAKKWAEKLYEGHPCMEGRRIDGVIMGHIYQNGGYKDKDDLYRLQEEGILHKGYKISLVGEKYPHGYQSQSWGIRKGDYLPYVAVTYFPDADVIGSKDFALRPLIEGEFCEGDEFHPNKKRLRFWKIEKI